MAKKSDFTVMSIRIDKKTKKDFKKAVEELGLDMSSALKLFIKKVIKEKKVPFEVE